MTSTYIELHCHSFFSLLDGASAPEHLATQAARVGLHGLALTDHDSLAGVVRFAVAARRAGLHPILGAEVTLADGCHLTLLAETQAGYANLCQLVSAARLDQLTWDGTAENWPGKVEPALRWSRLAEHSAGLIALSGCRQGPVAAPLLRHEEEAAQAALRRLGEIFGRDHLFVEIQHHALPQDDLLNRRLCALARQYDLPVVATGNVHYATRAAGRLRDALVAIRHNATLTEARRAGHLPLNHTNYLATPQEMARRFRELPQALRASVIIAERCAVSLDFSGRRLPTFPTPEGRSEFEHLYQRCHAELPKRYPRLQPGVLKQLAHELDVIERAGLAGYFLIVGEIISFATREGIRCQGRGSAANSIVAYLLGITNIDPLAHNLLFERFLSVDRFTMPDIDIDFAADRREAVIQHVYQQYGAAHAAMVCNVVTFQARSALRDLGKALEFPSEVIDGLVKRLEAHTPAAAADQLLAALPDEAAQPAHPVGLLVELMRLIDGCPRHLSIHSGGMLITGLPLTELVPLEPATMPGRVVVQWDKDSVEDAGLVKLDLLGLRMLGLISEALEHVQASTGVAPDLNAIPLDDPVLYEMLQRADTIGAFQVESRAQQQMLPRLKPTRFEDIIVEVAIVRPGPIQGGAVHPYLKRRAGSEEVRYPHPSLEPVLAETLGVLLFQEQAIRVAVAAAGFSPGEADLLRRALSRTRPTAELERLQERFLAGAAQQQIDRATAQTIWAMLAGFAGYGFPKSHASGFALIAYQSLYLKKYHAAAFYCALLNQQPMGFYSAEVISGDARRHGVTLLPPAANHSEWAYTLEQGDKGRPRLRTGLRAVKGLGEAGWQQIATARQAAPFVDLADFCQRTGLPKEEVSTLIRAGVLDDFGERRQLLWQLGEQATRPTGLALTTPVIATALADVAPLERMVWEYELLGLSPDGQVMGHYRPQLRRAGILSTWEVKAARAGERVFCAGMVVIRQRPATAKGILFMSLEDEAGLLDLVVKPEVYTQFRDVLRHEVLLLVSGAVQRAAGATSVLVYEAQALH